MIIAELLQADKGDCIFLKLDDVHILIDTGSGAKYQSQINLKLLKKYVPDGVLDLVILTHIDDDHIGGAPELIRDTGLHIREIWYNGYQHIQKQISYVGRGEKVSFGQRRMSVASADRLSVLIKQQNIDWNRSFNGNAVLRNISEPIELRKNLNLWVLNPGVKELDILNKVWNRKKQDVYRTEGNVINPDLEVMDAKYSLITSTPTNESSIVIVIQFHGKTMLFTGDASQNAWMKPLKEWCMYYNPSRHFDLIKVPHHGSNKSTNAEFYKEFTADYFLISTNGGCHRNQHPSNIVLAQIIKNNPQSSICFNYTEHCGYEFYKRVVAIEKKQCIVIGNRVQLEWNKR